jgi:hypothetical protein
MAEPDYSKSWYQRGGKKPFSETLAEHLRKELGPNAVHRYEAYSDSAGQLFDQFADKYGGDLKDWPESEQRKYFADYDKLESMFTRPHERKLFTVLEDIEATDPLWEPETTERTLRQQYPDLVSRMETGRVQPVAEPQQRLPTPQPQKPTIAPPMRTAPPTPKPVVAPVQKPAQVTSPYGKYADTIKGFEEMARKGAYKPSSTDWREKMARDLEDMEEQAEKQRIAQERLRGMMREEEPMLRGKSDVPVSLPEAVNPTGR